MSGYVISPAGMPSLTLMTREALRYGALVIEVWRTRRILAELDPRLLRDIGVSRGQALTEIARAPWDLRTRG